MAADLPLVTVVTPSFNQGRFIDATIRSVLAQDYPALEYLVIDGGSTDETLAILRSYGDLLSWVSAPDHGQADAINRGWRRGRGEILAWLNSDDLYAPGAVRAAVASLAQHPAAAGVYGDCGYIDADGQTIGAHRTAPFDYAKLLRTSYAYIPQPATFLRRAALEQVGYLDAQLTMVLDLDLWLRLGRVAPLAYVPQRWASFREHATSKTLSQQLRAAPEILMIIRRLFDDPSLPPELRALEPEALASAHVLAGNSLLMGGRPADARAYAWRGLRRAAPRMRLMALKILAVSMFGRAGLGAYLHGRQVVRLIASGRLRWS